MLLSAVFLLRFVYFFICCCLFSVCSLKVQKSFKDQLEKVANLLGQPAGLNTDSLVCRSCTVYRSSLPNDYRNIEWLILRQECGMLYFVIKWKEIFLQCPTITKYCKQTNSHTYTYVSEYKSYVGGEAEIFRHDSVLCPIFQCYIASLSLSFSLTHIHKHIQTHRYHPHTNRPYLSIFSLFCLQWVISFLQRRFSWLPKALPEGLRSTERKKERVMER